MAEKIKEEKIESKELSKKENKTKNEKKKANKKKWKLGKKEKQIKEKGGIDEKGRKEVRKFLVRYDKLVVMGLFICLLILIFILSREVTTGNRFYRDLVRGLDSSWKISNDETDVQAIEGKKQTDFILREYDAVYSYKNLEFKDEEIKPLAQAYISALEGCKGAIETYNPETDYDEFWKAFSPYYGQRIQSLCSLYKLKEKAFDDIKNKYPEKFKNLLLNGWAIERTASINFEKTKDKKGNEIYQATVLNDSGFDMEYFNIDILLLSEKSDIIDTTSAYVKDWAKNTQRTLEFYKTSKKVKAYKINGVTCK
ncbi:MAG: hypothetical protein Q4E61_01625 [Alphaproteobacteria bacterium]|nr:hypothetical protein [Alphaproteobacteria bacterium]